ncbi:MAG: hypothetical protein ABI576_19685 [Flavobacterium sp.]
MKTIIKLIAILFLLQSCISNSKKENVVNTIAKNESRFDAEEELSSINKNIIEKLADSVSNNNYKYWLKNGKIIKLNVVGGDGEDYITEEDYYFKDNNNVFAYQKKKMDFSNAIDYKALIYFNDSKVIKENYWISDIKTIKDSVENKLKRVGQKIQNEIILDEETNKSKGLLTLLYLSRRYGFDYQNVQNNKIGNEISENDNLKAFNEIQLTLTDATIKKAKLYLGEPDKEEYGFGHISKGFAIYYNKVANQNGEPKHLVLFLRMDGRQWGNNAKIEEIYSIDDNQKACFGIHCIMIKNQEIYTNALDLVYDRNYKSL